MKWFIIDQDCNFVLRGPYTHPQTAAAVRAEIEHYTNTDHNLSIEAATSIEDWYDKNPRGPKCTN